MRTILAAAAALALLGNPRDPSGPVRLRVATYNIHHGEGTDGSLDLARVANLILSMQPDLVALQEVDRGTARTGGVDQLVTLERLTGLRGVFGKAMDFDGGSYGVAILSRFPVLETRAARMPGAEEREPRAEVTAEVEMRPGAPPLQFTSTHLDNGRDVVSRLAQVRFLNATLTGNGDQPAILAGDLNSQADSSVVQVLRQEWSEMFTAPEPLGPQGMPRRRVDHVLGRPAASWRTLDSTVVDDRIASDHRPVVVTLEWK
jgi:endonuclease/exonuclease/phosphatase family metal-dependent hydrolase